MMHHIKLDICAGVYLYLARARGRPVRVREGERALAAHPHGGDHPNLGNLPRVQSALPMPHLPFLPTHL